MTTVEVVGTPHISSGRVENINATYSATTGRIVIDISADIVTLGVAANVLLARYSEALTELPDEAAYEIRNTIERVVNEHCETNRSKCIKSRSYSE